MKRIAIVLAALSLIATTAGAAPLKVVTTIQDLASLTKEVASIVSGSPSVASNVRERRFN